MAVLSPLPHDYTRPNTESNFEARAITSLAKKQQSILRKIAHEKPIRVNLNLPYKPLESTLSRADLSTEWSAEKPSHADIIIHQHYHPPPHHRHHNHHQHPHHYHHLIILINGSSRRSIIIISTIFIIITSTSSHHYHFYHHNHYRTIFIIIVLVVIVITTVWNKNMLKKRWSICHIRWDTIVILFHNLQKRSSLKKGLDFDMQKITSQSKLYIDCNDCGTVYVF